MSKFFVGQRVRIVWVSQPANSHLIGTEGRISEIRDLSMFTWAPIGLDCSPITQEFIDGEIITFGFKPEQLEPILPESSAPSEFTFQQLMDNLQEIYVGVRIPAPEVVEAAGFLAMARIGGEM